LVVRTIFLTPGSGFSNISFYKEETIISADKNR
jgi:hypothetical protein